MHRRHSISSFIALCGAFVAAPALAEIDLGRSRVLQEPAVRAAFYEDIGDPKNLESMLMDLFALAPSARAAEAWMKELGFSKEAADFVRSGIGDELLHLGFEVLDFFPDPTGPGTPIDPLGGLGSSGSSGVPGASTPGRNGLAMNDGVSVYPLFDGGVRVEEQRQSDDGTQERQYREYGPDGALREEGYSSTRPDGTTTDIRIEHRPDGSSRNTAVRRYPDGEKDVIVRESKPPADEGENANSGEDGSSGEQNGDDAGQGEKDKPEKIDQYQPADGSQRAGCPLFLPACRRAAEGIAKDLKDPYRLISGSVLVNPGEPDDEPKAPPLRLDPHQPVINPDPSSPSMQGSASAPRHIRIRFPVLVLPPKPGS